MKNPKKVEFNNETEASINDMRLLGYSEEEIEQFEIDQMEAHAILFDPYCGGH